MVKKYDIYGLGNAMVDMAYEVDGEFLKKVGVEKGLMTLVDTKRQDDLLSKVTHLNPKRTCGGSAANTTIAVAQLGGNSFYSCKIANDEVGDFYYEDLVETGVDTNAKNREAGTTGKCLIFITPDADRTFNTYLGISQNFSKNELVEKSLVNSKYLYIEGYLVTSPNAREAAIYARELA
ncbi:MAG: adenosine kinase, partial [Pseudomonadota bacterium]